MIQKQKRAWLSLFIAVGTAGVMGAAACSGGGGGGGSGSPSPSATTLTNCEVLWTHAGTAASHYDIYLIDAPLASWTTGDHSFDLTVGSETAAAFYDEYDFTMKTYLSRAISTNGTYSVVASGGSAGGQPLTLTDAGGHSFYAINGSGVVGMLVGSGGAANFNGVFSDPKTPDSPTPGTNSTVAITYNGVSETLGTPALAYALCYDATTFAPMTFAERIDAALARQFSN